MICIYNLFYEADNFCKDFEPLLNRRLIEDGKKQRVRESSLSLSGVMTIVILFRSSDFRHFRGYYTEYIMKHLRRAFPGLVSYNRFAELMQTALIPLCCYLNTRKGRVAGISFTDSTPVIVCHSRRAHSRKVFKKPAKRGKNSIGRFYGFRLHPIISGHGELIAFRLTPANTGDRKPVPGMTDHLSGKLSGDRGYISRPLFEELTEKGVRLITEIRKNMKNRLMPLSDKIMPGKRPLTETVNDQLKNISQTEHTRHRSPFSFAVNLTAGLTAYTWQPGKPSPNFNNPEQLTNLPVIF